MFTHPVYTINHKPCGHSSQKQILESSEFKRLQVKKAMELKRCARCIKESQS